ncbi:MAG: ABC transporter substrate-binding protein [Burkholderiales bacterium]
MHRLLLVVGAFVAFVGSAAASEPIKLSVARLTLPGAITAILDVLVDRRIDRRHGIVLEVKNYSNISAFYGATATGEVDMSVAGPWVLQRLRGQGSKVKGLFTFVGISSLGVVTADPKINSIQDLKGRTLAASMGSAEYLLLAMYAQSQGVVLGKDVTVQQASPPLARAMLEAGRVDAAMSWETNTTLLLRDNAKFRRIIGGEEAWAALTGSNGTHGWQLLLTIHEDALAKHPQAVAPLLAMWREAAAFLKSNTAEAEAIDFRTIKLPVGVLSEAIGSKRLAYDIQPVWGREREGIWDSFKLGVKYGYLKEMPDPGILYAP